MYPLVHIGSYLVQTWNIFLILGMVLGVAVPIRLAHHEKLNVPLYAMMGYSACVVGYFGCKIMSAILAISAFEGEMDLHFLAHAWRSGFVWYGAPLCAVPYGISVMYLVKQPLWKALDCAGPGLIIGQMVGRIGCFFAGCCYGRQTRSFWGVESPYYPGIYLHPVQLYEFFVLFCVMSYLLYTFFYKKYDGQVFVHYLIVGGAARFFTEFFRGDDVRGTVWLFSTSQFIALLFMVLGILLSRSKLLFKSLRRVF